MPAQEFHKIVVVQTAFAGDVILTLPLVQVLKRHYPAAQIDLVVIPRTAELLLNHPAVNSVVAYDKRGKDAGISGLFRLAKKLHKEKYDIAFVPHRSLRSAALVRLANIKQRVGFDQSSGRFLFTKVVHYEKLSHEIERNLSLLSVVELITGEKEFPQLYPSFHDREKIGLLLSEFNIQHLHTLIAVAPGSVWNTKRWLKERFVELIDALTVKGYHVVLIGGAEDAELCNDICKSVSSPHVYNTAGKLKFLQSADLIKRCLVLISNDSAPMHIAAAVQTPVAAIFGATAPEYGFAPYGQHDVVVETKGLSCRPCSIHGGKECPTGTFDCMKRITVDDVLIKILPLVARQ